MNRPILKLASGLLVLAGIGGIGWRIAHGRHEAAAPAAACGQAQPEYWYDPMKPDQHFDQPGKSPFMDMPLIAKCPEPAAAADAAGTAAAGSVAIDPRVVQNLGVRLAPVETGRFARAVDAVGLVAVDEHRIQAVQVRAPGWVEQLAVRAVGDPVRRGQLLAGVYSPDLLAAQEELLIALDSGDAGLIGATRQRLVLAGLSEGQIAQVERTRKPARRVDYFAPFDGYVMELGARQGAAVQMDTLLFQLADLGSVWITAEVPEAQAGWIKPGDSARAEVPALPGERFEAAVDYLYPELSAATRTLKVRLVVRNPAGHLRPGMFASVHLLGEARDQVLMVPTEAVIRTGARSVVIVADDASHFRPALVRVGAEYAGRSEIIDGLAAGQQVVASGQFLIDSEASLRSAFANLTGTGEPGPGGSDEAAKRMPLPGQGQ